MSATALHWLPVAADFRSDLKAASQGDDAAQLQALQRLARHRLGFIEEIQLDHALRSLLRRAGARFNGFPALRLAVLSSSTADQLLPSIRVAGLRHGLLIDVRCGGYGQFTQDLLDPGSWLAEFRPDAVLLSLSAAATLPASPLAADASDVEAALKQSVDDLRLLWRAVRDRWSATPVQQTVIDVGEPLFGSLDAQVPGAPHRLAGQFNARLHEAAAAERVAVVDVARATARDGLDAWFDIGRWLQGKMEVAPSAASRYGELLARVLAAQLGRSRKCLVLDLDNTLWGGVIGDDGLKGISIGEGSALGEAHLALQRYARRLTERGILLAVCSKNDPAAAEAPFRDHADMLLRLSDFASFVANWHDKAANLQQIAAELNLGLDALVFVDDNPAERERIRNALPMVAVPELPADPALYVRCIADAGYFEATSFTREDRERVGQYRADAERTALRSQSASLDDYLQGLRMSLVAGPVTALELARAAQLINKTNQFNTTTRRLAGDELERFLARPGHAALQFRLLDRFGDNGLVSVLLLSPSDGEVGALQIDNWVMSCRVFGRQLEEEILNVAAETARTRGALALAADLVRTERNGVIAGLYERLGFARDDAAALPAGHSRWRLDLAGYRPRTTFIRREPS